MSEDRHAVWLIESGTQWLGKPQYWNGDGVGQPTSIVDFTDDPNRAIQFARRQDAEIVRDAVLKNVHLRVTQHVFLGTTGASDAR